MSYTLKETNLESDDKSLEKSRELSIEEIWSILSERLIEGQLNIVYGFVVWLNEITVLRE